MPGPPTLPPERLDSWKAIADYLNRDVATVRRWEKTRGLPVRRVQGAGSRSIFAYPSEIDAWLNGPGHEVVVASEIVAPASRSISSSGRWQLAAAIALVSVIVAAVVWRFRTPTLRAEELRIDVTPDAIVAFDRTGVQRWRHEFAPSYRTALPDFDDASRVVTGPNPAVYVAISHRLRRSDGVTESGELLSLSTDGKPGRLFSFNDQVAFDGVTYGPPWAITSFAVDDSGGRRRTAVAAHHFQWAASLATVLDENWQRRGTFAHAGWIETVRWLAPTRLLIAGFSESRDGGMVALLDPAALNGQGPEPAGTRYSCDGCGTAVPVRMIVMPRTEVNRVTGSPFNRAVVQMTPDRIVARTIEVPSAAGEAVDALYEFSLSLDLVRASFSARYWDAHRALERRGALAHTRETCPDRDGPREIQVWNPGTGWATIKTSASRADQ